MERIRTAKIFIAGLIFSLVIGSTSIQAQIAVIDAANLQQNIFQVLRMIEEIKLTYDQLQNMLLNTRNGPAPWATQLPLLLQLGNVLQRGQSLAFTMQNIDQRFINLYPGYQTPKNWNTSYLQWTNTSLNTLRNTLASLGVDAESIAWDATRIGVLSAANAGAVGRMAAIQAGGAIGLEGINHLQRLENIARTQASVYAVVEANKQNKEAALGKMGVDYVIHGQAPIPTYGSSGGIDYFRVP